MNKVKSFRAGIGYSQKVMADTLEISENQYRAKEKGQYDFTTSEMKKFINVIRKHEPNVNYEDIFF